MPPTLEKLPSGEGGERSPLEYGHIMNDAVREGVRIAEKTREQSFEEPSEIMDFLKTSTRLGRPRPNNQIEILTPDRVHLPLTLVPCFSDDPIPLISQSRIGTKGTTEIGVHGYYNPGNKLLVLADVERKPTFDLAFSLLHEARHARQDLDPRRKDETKEQEEANTWFMGLRIYEAVGGEAWKKSVATELEFITKRFKEKRSDQRKVFIASLHSYEDLNQVLGETRDPRILQDRSIQVAMAANSELLMATNSNLSREKATEMKVKAFYTWATTQKN